jgi:hypothetical protein
MNPLAAIRRYLANVENSHQILGEIREGIANLTDAARSPPILGEIREGIANLTDAARSPPMLGEIREGIANLTDVTNRHLMNLAVILDSIVQETQRANLTEVAKSRQMLEEIREGIANLTDVTNRHLIRLAEILVSAVQESKRAGAQNASTQISAEVRKGFANLSKILDHRLDTAAGQVADGSRIPAMQRSPPPKENDLESYAHVFDDIVPYSGTPPRGFFADWLGVLHDGTFRAYLGVDHEAFGGVPVQTNRPTLAQGEVWFEAVNQVEAARDARGRYVMVTLGACYGAQAVGSAVALRKLNPMSFKLVAIEPEPVAHEWVARHFRDNDIDPDEHWLIKAAISDSNSPVFFPVGAPGSGVQNSFATNEAAARENYVQALIESGHQDEALCNLLLRNTTGLTKSPLPGEGFDAEITLVSAVTLADILTPLTRVDYLEADIQQSEILVFPPFMGLLKRKVRRLHIGTHGKAVHDALSDMFRRDGWRIVFDFEPNSSHTHPLGSFHLNDGVLTVLNPDFR